MGKTPRERREEEKTPREEIKIICEDNELFVVLPINNRSAFKRAREQGAYILNDAWPVKGPVTCYSAKSLKSLHSKPGYKEAVEATHIVYKFVAVSSVSKDELAKNYSDCAKVHAGLIDFCPRHGRKHEESYK